ncbi:NAD-glutamate dehydrogenase [Vibrio chagasii]|nr:NAD-glutamate dehydrogenase [Vibrio chagasii]
MTKVTAELANSARLFRLYSALDISRVKRVKQYNKRLNLLQSGATVCLALVLKQINGQAADNNWQALARAASVRRSGLGNQSPLTGLPSTCGQVLTTDQRLDDCMESNSAFTSLGKNLKRILKKQVLFNGFAKFSVALRELMPLLNLNRHATPTIII